MHSVNYYALLFSYKLMNKVLLFMPPGSSVQVHELRSCLAPLGPAAPVLLDEVGGLLGHHDGRGVRVAAGHRGEHRGVHHPQALGGRKGC